MNWYTIIKEANQDSFLPNRYYHGSIKHLKPGTILKPSDDYENDWQDTDFYEPLNYYKPNNMLSHKESVFMVTNEDDVDLAGGGTEWLFTVRPLGKVQRHDLNWSSEISMLVGDDPDDISAIKQAAMNYWNGVPHHNESVWEYLTTSAEILSVERY